MRQTGGNTTLTYTCGLLLVIAILSVHSMHRDIVKKYACNKTFGTVGAFTLESTPGNVTTFRFS